MEFHSPDGKISTSHPINGIVDDTTVEANVSPAGVSVLEEGHAIAQEWENLLFLSGGTLARNKCFFYHVDWKWKGGIATMVDPVGSKISLMRGDLDPLCAINRKTHAQAHRTLGVRISPNGNWAVELDHLKNKIRRFNARLHKSFLTSHEVMMAMRTRFEPSVSYSLGVTGFSEQQCEQLQKLARPVWLQKLGYSLRYPSAVAHAPRDMGGIWMIQFFAFQGHKGLEMMLGHLRAQTEVGKMVQIGLDYFRLISGRANCPFRYPQETTAYPLKDWFHLIREYLAKTESCIIYPMPKYMLPKCQGDVCLMDHAILPTWSPSDARAINRCRLFLCVIYLSDITHGDGRTLMRPTFWGVKPLSSSLLWPNQGKPSEYDWRKWRSFLRQEFLQQDGSMNLRQPLGPWHPSLGRHHRQWQKHCHQHGVCIQRSTGWRLFHFRRQG